MGVGVQLHTPATLSPRKEPGTYLREAGWAPVPLWTVAENLDSTGIRSQDRSARSESLHRLRYYDPHEVLKG
jgi:hypothetical protein